jgi:uncharacterized repeat protein (TIGR03803 family)
MKTNNNRRKKEMAPFIGAIRLALSVILLGGTGAFAQTLTTLRDFGSNMDGQNPQAGVVFDQRGHLYGTAALGGVDGNGIVYRLTPPEGTGGPWRGSVLHKFSGQPDGAVPVSSLTLSPSGDLFGTTEEGGAHNKGTVFGLQPPQNPGDSWRERVFYSFGSSATDGVVPNSELLPANPGFYGVTREGGAHGFGTVFLVAPQAGGGTNWSETILYSFAGSGDAAFPSGGLVADQAGNLYGTTLVGGANDLGAVYQLSPPTTEGGAWTETVIFSFSGSDGTLPFGRLQFDETGAIYGTTTSGGSGQAGTVFKLTPQSQPGVSWNESVLYNFSGGRDGGSPFAGVVIDNRGTLFGTASTGGAGHPLPGGVIFRLTPPASEGVQWTETVLHAFGGPDGFRPLSRLIRRSGSFYGTTSSGGLNGTGTVFVLTP